jgi:hypothetical protein
LAITLEEMLQHRKHENMTLISTHLDKALNYLVGNGKLPSQRDKIMPKVDGIGILRRDSSRTHENTLTK